MGKKSKRKGGKEQAPDDWGGMLDGGGEDLIDAIEVYKLGTALTDEEKAEIPPGAKEQIWAKLQARLGGNGPDGEVKK